jgi:hypothetical protein
MEGVMMTVTTLRVLPFFAVLTLLSAAPSAAQGLPEPWADPLDRPPRVDFGVNVGVDAETDWSDLVLLGSISPAFGVVEQVLVRDLRVEPDTQVSGTVTYWRGRYGFRAQAGLSRSRLILGGQPVELSQPAVTRRASSSIDLDTYSYDVRGVVGLVEYTPRTWVFPYASFGFGGMTYHMDDSVAPPLLTFIDHGRTATGNVDELVVVDQGGSEFLLSVDEVSDETVFAFNLAFGTDVRLPIGGGGIGLRLEASDHIAPSPVGLQIGELRRASLLATDTGATFGLVHHLRLSAGFVVFLGR